MINPRHTFSYEFTVQDSGVPEGQWIGRGSGRAFIGSLDGLAGPKPRFELTSGWLRLLPTDGWTRSFPILAFSDQVQVGELGEKERIAALNAHGDACLEALEEARKEAAEKYSPKEQIDAYTKEENAAVARVLRQRGLTRDCVSFSVFVGNSLSSVLRSGDELKYSRDGNGDFRYSVERNAETVFSAGTVGRSDPGGLMAVWQEYDRHPNSDAQSLMEQHPTLKLAELFEVHKPYITARIQEQHFHLLDGQDARTERHYVFLARSNRHVIPLIAFEFWPRAVHSAGRLDLLSKDQIIDAAQKLADPYVELL